jgi:hypothetical protein
VRTSAFLCKQCLVLCSAQSEHSENIAISTVAAVFSFLPLSLTRTETKEMCLVQYTEERKLNIEVWGSMGEGEGREAPRNISQAF